jgi:hypothetical protein
MENLVYNPKEKRYTARVTWKYGEPSLPFNKMAVKFRQQNFEKYAKRRGIWEDVKKVIKNNERKGYMHKLTDQEKAQEIQSKDAFYLPYFAVVNMDRLTTKVRLVYDSAAKYDGVSLNDRVDPRPNLINSLVQVLIRFREKPIAICGDVAEMYHQIALPPEDLKYQRLFFEGEEYQFDRVMFGNPCSPTLSQAVIRKHAHYYANEFPKAAKVLRENVYVDDVMTSFDNEEEAIQVRKEVTHVMKNAGLNVRKVVTNNENVLNSIPSDEVSPVFQLENKEVNAASTKVLGLSWTANKDVLNVIVNLPQQISYTKRGAASLMSRVYDPLELLSPVTIRSRVMMQEAHRETKEWDAELPEKLREAWEQWVNEIRQMDKIKIKRALQNKMKKVEAQTTSCVC